MTQTELARRSGVSRATINYIERGQRLEIGSKTLCRLAKALGVGVDELLESPKRQKRTA
jgi:transcriptional regulator with XRE-family HTH domain